MRNDKKNTNTYWKSVEVSNDVMIPRKSYKLIRILEVFLVKVSKYGRVERTKNQKTDIRF